MRYFFYTGTEFEEETENGTQPPERIYFRADTVDPSIAYQTFEEAKEVALADIKEFLRFEVSDESTCATCVKAAGNAYFDLRFLTFNPPPGPLHLTVVWKDCLDGTDYVIYVVP